MTDDVVGRLERLLDPDNRARVDPLLDVAAEALHEIERLRTTVAALEEQAAAAATDMTRLRRQLAQLLPWAEVATRRPEWDGVWDMIALSDGDISQAEYDADAAWRARRDDIHARITAGEFGDVAAALVREAQAAGVELDRAALVDVWPTMADEEHLRLYRDSSGIDPGEPS